MELLTLNVEVVLKPVAANVEAFIEAMQDLQDYVEDSPWCGLQHVVEQMELAITAKESASK